LVTICARVAGVATKAATKAAIAKSVERSVLRYREAECGTFIKVSPTISIPHGGRFERPAPYKGN
jgi:hypothetical protein